MNHKRFSHSRSRAFAFSVDILLALILITSLFLFASLPTQPAPKLEERRITDQFIDDVFVALDHSGYVGHELDVNGFSTLSLSHVRDKTSSLIPETYDVHLQLTQYPVDVNGCRAGQTFEDCFPDSNNLSFSVGPSLPTNAEFVHGRRIFLQQQPASQCTSSLSPASGNPFALHAPRDNPLYFQSAGDLNVTFDVNVTPAGPWTCDQNITVDLSVSSGSGTRKPVDMMLVVDRSGSMSYDVHVDTTDALGLDIDSNYIFVADSTGGLRDLNLISAGYPALVGTYNTPGTARDVDVVGNYAFIADGTSGLRIANVTTRTAPSSTSQLSLGGDAYAVVSNGNTTWVGTYSATSTDISNTGNSNNVLTIGRNSSNEYGAQSFQPTLAYITGVSVRIRKVGNPGDLTLHIRSSIGGSNLATATLSSSSVTTSYQQLTATFPSALGLTPGSTYYLVLTTASNNSSNYYEWGTSSNAYSGGQSFQNSTSQSRDARFETFFIPGLVRVDTTNKSAPIVVGAASLTDPWRIWLDDTTAYVADGSAGLRVFNVVGNTPVLLGTYNSPGTAYDVTLVGTTAYLADGSSGLRVVDVSTTSAPTLAGTYNTPGTAYGVRVHGSTAYVADSSSLQIIDVSTPASPTFVRSFSTPWRYRDLEIDYPWGYFAIDNSIEGIASVNLENGTKMDQAIVAATTFVDFNGWDAAVDQLGLVSYSSSATTDQTLTQNFSLVKADINALVANGGTATGDGINAATTELTSVRHNSAALTFQILMSDGLTNAGANSATAAITALNNDIIIYTIGFGLDADSAELSNIATITGGRYYAALDQNALIDVYALIAQDIQLLATDANIAASIPTGTVLVDDGNGLLGGGFLTFDINTQTPQPWRSTYTFNIPCDSRLACSSTLLTIPSPGTQFQYIDANGNPQSIDWNVFSTQTFNYHDLNLEILSGNIIGSGNTDLTVRVQSIGNLDTDPTSVSFYNGNPSADTLITTASVPALCGAQASACSLFTYDFTHNVPAEGDLFAVVNPSQAIPECSFNNQDVIYCYSTPSTTFFTLDYWVWLRE